MKEGRLNDVGNGGIERKKLGKKNYFTTLDKIVSLGITNRPPTAAFDGFLHRRRTQPHKITNMRTSSSVRLLLDSEGLLLP